MTSAVFVIHPTEMYADSLATSLSAHDINVIGYSNQPDSRIVNANVFVVDCDSPSVPLPRLIRSLRHSNINIQVIGLSSGGLTPEQAARANIDSIVSKSSQIIDICEKLGKKSLLKRPTLKSEGTKSILESLTTREAQAYVRVIGDMSNVEIAVELEINASTVGEYKKRVLTKFGVDNVYELKKLANATTKKLFEKA